MSADEEICICGHPKELHIFDDSDIFKCDCDCDGYVQSVNCICGHIYVGGTRTESKNLNYDCPEHGVESAWYNSYEQVEKRRIQSERLRDLFRQAKEARNAARGLSDTGDRHDTSNDTSSS